MADDYKKPNSAEDAAFEIHEFLFKPTKVNGPTRAAQLDQVFTHWGYSKFSVKAISWISGIATVVIGFYLAFLRLVHGGQ